MDIRLRFLICALLISGIANSQDFELLELTDYGELTHSQLELLNTIPEKVDLNRADSIQLIKTGIFESVQIHNLLKYRRENGDLLSFHELQVIDGFELSFIGTLAIL